MGLTQAIGYLKLDTGITATDRRGPADELDLLLYRPGEVETHEGGHALVE